MRVPENLIAPEKPKFGPGFCSNCGAEANPIAYRIGTTAKWARACIHCKHVDELEMPALAEAKDKASAAKAAAREELGAHRGDAGRVIKALLAAIPSTAFAATATQNAIYEGLALLAKLGQPLPDRFEAANAAWLAAKAGR